MVAITYSYQFLLWSIWIPFSTCSCVRLRPLVHDENSSDASARLYADSTRAFDICAQVRFVPGVTCLLRFALVLTGFQCLQAHSRVVIEQVLLRGFV